MNRRFEEGDKVRCISTDNDLVQYGEFADWTRGTCKVDKIYTVDSVSVYPDGTYTITLKETVTRLFLAPLHFELYDEFVEKVKAAGR